MAANFATNLTSKYSKMLLIGTAIASSLTVSHAAFAQDQPPAQGAASGSQGLEEIVVTAQRKSEKLEAVPISVSAFSQKQLENLGLKDTGDLQFATPGLVFPFDDNVSTPYIRGVGTGFSGGGLEGSVAEYVDDVYYEGQFSGLQNFLDLDQIQVLKGPQGTLYGRNATGGALLITSHNPTNSFEGHLTAGAGNLDDKFVEAVVNVPVTDKLSARFAGSWEDRAPYVHNQAFTGQGADQGGFVNYQLRGKLLWTPTDDLEVLATVSYTLNRSDGLARIVEGGRTCVGCELYGYKPPTGFYDTIQSRVPLGDGEGSTDLVASIRAKYDIDDNWSVTSISAYHLLSMPSAYSDQDYTPANYEIFQNGGSGDTVRKNRTYTEELRASSTYDSKLNYAAGVFIEKDQSFYPGELYGSALGGLNPQVMANNLTWNYAAYAEGYYNFTPDLKLTLGGRYNTDRRFYDSQANAASAIISGLNPATFTGDRGNKNFYDFTPRAVLAYDVGMGNVYFSWNRGFKSGGYNLPSFGVQTPVASEKIEAFELGAKLHFFDNRLRTESAVFHYGWKNMQVAFVDTKTGGLKQENAAAAESTGAEQSFDAAVTDQLTVGGSVAYLHARYVSFKSAASYFVTPAPGIGEYVGGLDLSGTPIPDSPSYTGTLYATYKFDLPADWKSAVTVLGRFQTKSDFDAGAGGPQHFDQQGAYGIVNITGTITPPDMPMSLDWFIDNVGGVKYATFRQASSLGNYYLPGLPLTFGGRVTYNFGGESEAAREIATYAPPPGAAPAPQVPHSYLVFFDFNKSDLTPQAVTIVDQAAKNAAPMKVTQLTVTGHTDTVGSDAYNMRLSRRRAESVAAQLEKDGIPSSEIAIVAKGKRDLLVPTADGVKEPQNRRVQIVYEGSPTS